MTGSSQITSGIDHGGNEYLAEGRPGAWLWHVRSIRGERLFVMYYGNYDASGAEFRLPRNWVLV